MEKSNTTFVISRTDSIGDVVLTLPLAGILKQAFPNCRVVFLGRGYTLPVIATSKFVDEALNADELLALPLADQVAALRKLQADAIVHVFPNRQVARLAKKAGIPLRIGTAHRWFHWLTCTHLPRFSRRRSDLHEAQLNTKLLEPLGVPSDWPLESLIPFYGFEKIGTLPERISSLLQAGKQLVILHPKSKGSAREWGLEHFGALIRLLPPSRFQVLVAGTKAEGDLMRPFLEQYQRDITDLTGQLTLTEYIALIHRADSLVAASTGPLHIAAALGKQAIGLFAPMRPIHPGRWQPVGGRAQYLVLDKDCEECRKSQDCACIRSISPQQVAEKLLG